jgi:hypothetical protein
VTCPEEIISFARDRLAHFKAPQGVTFVTELPKTATGKIQIVHRPESGRRSSSRSPALLRTITLADGLRLIGLGAAGSCQ